MIKIGTALFEAAEQLEKEKGISKDVLISSLCDALVAAYKKHIRDKDAENVEAILDEASGEIGVFRTKLVVKEVENEDTEISLADAKDIDDDVELEDEVKIEVTPDDFGRIAAQSAKQVITQRIREAERKLVLDEFMNKKGTLITGIVQRRDDRNVIVNIGKTDAIMPQREQLPGEFYKPGNRIRVFVVNVKETQRLPQVIVSQAHSEIVRELFELEVPEIEDGIVEVKSIAREAGFRTKLAVWSNDPSVDSVGACIGPRGSRIQTIVGELKNEKIDIVRYSEDPVEYIVNALSPARILSVDILADDEFSKEALVVVPDDQLSLAIGREGQNVRLAHRLTGWKIDIKNETQARALEDAKEAEILAQMEQGKQQEKDDTLENLVTELDEATAAYEVTDEQEEAIEEIADEAVEALKDSQDTQTVEAAAEKPKKAAAKKPAVKKEAVKEDKEEKPKKTAAKKTTAKSKAEDTAAEKPKKATAKKPAVKKETKTKEEKPKKAAAKKAE